MITASSQMKLFCIGTDDQRSMVVATHHIGIARMLIVGADWLVEADCG